MAQQSKHEEVCIQAVQAMPRIRVISRLRLGMPDIFHNLMLSFAWNLMSR